MGSRFLFPAMLGKKALIFYSWPHPSQTQMVDYWNVSYMEGNTDEGKDTLFQIWGFI